MDIEAQRLPNDFSGEVRLFPLPNVVLYPGCILPLHIFESRYREMFEDAIASDQLITIATLLPGYESDYYSRPPISEHVCIGRVVMHEQTEQGTYNLVLVGIQRAAIVDELVPVRSYRRAKVQLVDEQDAEQATQTALEMGKALAQRFSAVNRSAAKISAEFEKEDMKLSRLTDVVSFFCDLEIDMRLKLLEEPDAIQRAHMLLAALPAPCVPPIPGDFPPAFGAN